MEPDFEMNDPTAVDDETSEIFREVMSLLADLSAKPTSQMTPEELGDLGSFLTQALEQVKGGAGDESIVNEIFTVVNLSSKLCLGFDDVQSTQEKAASESVLQQLREIFYLANELFTATTSFCLGQNIPISRLWDVFQYVRSCQKLDVKMFLQASKTFISVLEANRSTAVSGNKFTAKMFIDFLQSIVISDLLLGAKRTATAIKVAGFVLRNLSTLYASFGPTTFIGPESMQGTVKFLVDLHAVHYDYAKCGNEAEALTSAYGQFVSSLFQAVLQPLLRHEHFMPSVIGFNFSESPLNLKAAWLCLVVNLFLILNDTKTVSQTTHIDQLLDTFLRKFCKWASDESSVRQWPWPVVGSVKVQSPLELYVVVVSKLVLRSAVEEASQFFTLEQILLLALTGRSNDSYPVLARVLISDVLAFMTRSSLKLALRYTSLLSDFISKTAQVDEVASVLVPPLLKRIFDNIADDQKAKIIEGAIDELVRSFPSVASAAGRRTNGVYSMSEAFRMLEACTVALMKAPSPNDRQSLLLVHTVRLFAYLTWWTSSSPDLMKSSKAILEKITFSMWAILSITASSNDTSCHPLLVLFAQSIFEASKAVIIGVNNFENSAKFWAAAGQFFEIATLPSCVRQLFIVWLLKVVDSNTLANVPAAQKLLENCLYSDEKPSLMHGVLLSNLANRLALKNAQLTKLSPKLRIQAEAFSQQLFCIPFSKLAYSQQSQ